MNHLFILSLAFILFLSTEQGSAWQINPAPKPEDAYFLADAVFSAKVLAVKKNQVVKAKSALEPGPMGEPVPCEDEISLLITRTFKGKSSGKVKLKSCSQQFKDGVEYLVFASHADGLFQAPAASWGNFANPTDTIENSKDTIDKISHLEVTLESLKQSLGIEKHLKIKRYWAVTTRGTVVDKLLEFETPKGRTYYFVFQDPWESPKAVKLLDSKGPRLGCEEKLVRTAGSKGLSEAKDFRLTNFIEPVNPRGLYSNRGGLEFMDPDRKCKCGTGFIFERNFGPIRAEGCLE